MEKMWHPDEGLVHTWLDGAASAGEASAIESHIASCNECRASVVEARGLVAGASRIVGSLDSVPGGVIPFETSANASTSGARFRKPSFWNSSVFRIAAGFALIAGVSSIVVRQQRQVAGFYRHGGVDALSNRSRKPCL